MLAADSYSNMVMEELGELASAISGLADAPNKTAEAPPVRLIEIGGNY